mgnify:CR=1 FL=1
MGRKNSVGTANGLPNGLPNGERAGGAAAGSGAPVELWGKEIKIDDVAASSGTVGYELMCALAPRVPVVTL